MSVREGEGSLEWRGVVDVADRSRLCRVTRDSGEFYSRVCVVKMVSIIDVMKSDWGSGQ